MMMVLIEMIHIPINVVPQNQFIYVHKPHCKYLVDVSHLFKSTYLLSNIVIFSLQ